MTDLTVTVDWETLQRQCKAFIASGFLPEHITHEGRGHDKRKIPEAHAIAKAVTIVTIGHELGVPPLLALRTISVIKGKPCLQAELILGLCYKRVPGFMLEWLETTNEKAVCRAKREGQQWQTFSFTIADAKQAQLLGSADSGWGKYPAAMLRARVTSLTCRAIAPDATMNLYSPEELGGEVIEQEGTAGAVQTPLETLEAQPPTPTTTPEETAAPEPNNEPVELFPFEVEAPKAPTRPPAPTTGKIDWQKKAMTAAQRGKIEKLRDDCGMNSQEFMEFVMGSAGCGFEELTQGEASDLIDSMKKLME